MAVYLIHFDKPYRHAKHYIGFAASKRNVELRLTHHKAGRGARLLRVLNEVGISYKIVRVWDDGDRTFERKLKRRKNTGALCPVCCGKEMTNAQV